MLLMLIFGFDASEFLLVLSLVQQPLHSHLFHSCPYPHQPGARASM
jgi:hypothetical protein